LIRNRIKKKQNGWCQGREKIIDVEGRGKSYHRFEPNPSKRQRMKRGENRTKIKDKGGKRGDAPNYSVKRLARKISRGDYK